MSETERSISASGYKLMSIIWKHEPVSSTQVVKLAAAELGWKKSTTFTMLKRLSEAGYCVNNESVVTSLVKPEEVKRQSCHSVAEMARTRFDGSIPQFIASFVRSEELSRDDAESIMDMLREYIDESDE